MKRGIIHVYVANDTIYSTAEKLLEINETLLVLLLTGSSDIVGFFLYENTRQLIGLISEIKGIEGIDRIAWSEEVYILPFIKTENIYLCIQD